MYKLVAIDLDGTLLNSYGEVSDKTRKALQEAKNRGIEIVLASRTSNWLYKKYSNRAWSF